MHARFSASPLLSIILLSLSACGPSHAPDSYAPNAVQHADKVDPGTIVGVRDAGAQVGSSLVSAFSALSGTLLGGLKGAAPAQRSASEPGAFEYIVRKDNGDLVSVTQKDAVPLVVGQKVLVVAGSQARVVPDYSANAQPGAAKETAAAPAPPPASPSPPALDTVNSPGNSSGVPDAGEQGAAHASGS